MFNQADWVQDGLLCNWENYGTGTAAPSGALYALLKAVSECLLSLFSNLDLRPFKQETYWLLYQESTGETVKTLPHLS